MSEEESEINHFKLTESDEKIAENKIKEAHPLMSLKLSQVFQTKKLLKSKVLQKHLQLETEADVKKSQSVISDDSQANKEIDFNLEEGEDPITRLGFGMVFYFNLMTYLIAAMLIMTLASIPLYGEFATNQITTDEWGGLMIGSLGQAEVDCVTVKLNSKGVTLDCREGGQISAITQYGIFADDSEADYDGICNSDSGKNTGFSEKCAFLSQPNGDLYQRKLKPCLGKSNCFVPRLREAMPSTKVSNQTGCTIDQSAQVFIQYECKLNEKQLFQTRRIGQLSGFVSVLSALGFLVFVEYLQRKKVEEMIEEWDLDTTTASDYTLEIKISDEDCKYIKDYKPKNNKEFPNQLSEGLTLKINLKEIIETKAKKLMQKNKNINSSIPSVQVADINFTFNNGKIINLVKERKSAINDLDLQKFEKISRKIMQELDATTNVKNYYNPNSAFITFNTQDAYNWFRLNKTKLFGKKSKETIFKRAPEPTNIIWENRFVSKQEVLQSTIYFILVVSTLIVLAFFSTFLIESSSDNLKDKYDKMDCLDLNKTYSFNQTLMHSLDEWHDYYVEQDNEDKHKKISGVLPCFCQQQLEKFTAAGLNFDGALYSDQKNPKGVAICDEWITDQTLQNSTSWGLSILLIVINFVFQFFVDHLVKNLKYSTITAQSNAMMITQFFLSFLNTTVLVLLLNANFSESNIAFLRDSLNVGSHTDMDSEWYKEVGTLFLQNALINAISPPLEFLTEYLFVMIWKWYDQFYTCDNTKSRQKTFSAFWQSRLGPEFGIEFRMSRSLFTLAIALIFGPAFPLLYPITLLSFIILWTTERLLICYWYQLPPLYDITMAEDSLKIMKLIPIATLVFTFWQLGNKQIFENFVVPLSNKNQAKHSGHNLWTSITGLSWTSPNLLPFVAIILVSIFLIAECFEKQKIKKVKEDEQLNSYFEALSKYGKKCIIRQEDYFGEKYDIRTMDDQTLSKIREFKQKDELKQLPQSIKRIEDCQTYRIVDNRIYKQKLHYYNPREDQAKFKSIQRQNSSLGDQHARLSRRAANDVYKYLYYAFLPIEKRENFNVMIPESFQSEIDEEI